MGVYTGIAQDNVTIISGKADALTLRSVVSLAPVTKTASFTLGAYENFVVCNGAGSITVTFPTASANSGRVVWIKTIAAQTVVSASSNVKPINSNTAGTAILAASAGAWAMLVCDGTSWIIMAS
jgi:hypothetical protein